MTPIRAGSGLGDSLYLRPIVDFFVRDGRRLEVLSDYPAIFEGSGAKVLPFERIKSGIVAHYAGGKQNPATTQFEDMLASAGITAPVPLRFDWAPRNDALIAELRGKARGRPLIIAHGGRAPMGRIDGYGKELLPAAAAFDDALSALIGECFVVRVGKATPLYQLPAHMDLNRRTSVADLLDVASICDGIVAQCSFAVPLAEAFDRPLLAIWAAKGLASRDKFIAAITPRKILTNRKSSYVVDDWPTAKIQEAARGFRIDR